MIKNIVQAGMLCLLSGSFIACEQSTDSGVEYYPKPVFDRAKVDKGFKIFAMHCQKCHGVNGRGASNWRTPDSEGKYPAPPLNGTGHTWHHKREVLANIIMNGTQPQGNMPAWKDKLSDEDVGNVITWFQSMWSPKVYNTWLEIDNR